MKILVLTGSGVSAESGIATFRDADGLWENYSIDDVATPAGWKKDRELVLDFYNERRKQSKEVKPNAAHIALAELEKDHEVNIITQNVDDLHERAGSTSVLHLHGELSKSRSSVDASLIYDVEGDINIGDKCEKGSQLRPHIVWFTEDVPAMKEAYQLAGARDIDACIIVGTSFSVYPAAELYEYVDAPIYIIDPNDYSNTLQPDPNIKHIQDIASTGVPNAISQILKQDKK